MFPLHTPNAKISRLGRNIAPTSKIIQLFFIETAYLQNLEPIHFRMLVTVGVNTSLIGTFENLHISPILFVLKQPAIDNMHCICTHFALRYDRCLFPDHCHFALITIQSVA
jgi:hypothetical protein